MKRSLAEFGFEIRKKNEDRNEVVVNEIAVAPETTVQPENDRNESAGSSAEIFHPSQYDIGKK